jgi:serine/threonine protein phosphatase PrpC
MAEVRVADDYDPLLCHAFEPRSPQLCAEVAFFSYGGRKGPRWKACNQDDCFVLPLVQEGESQASHFVLGVFDGHGENGQGVASLLRETFYKEFSRFAEKRRNNYFSDMRTNENLMREVFREVESVVEAHPDDLSNSGATAVIIAVSPTLVTSAWLGDSRAILGLTETIAGSEDLGRGTRALIPLTQDHKPDPFKCPSEARRILGVGGRIDRLYTDSEGRPIGPYRIFLQNQWSPGLAVSRSFGDFVAQNAGLIAEPDIQTLSIPGTPQPGFKNAGGSLGQKHIIIVGSDGLWEWISNEEAMQIAWEMESAKDVAFKLAEIAKKHWAVKCGGKVCDDITVGVTFLPVE